MESSPESRVLGLGALAQEAGLPVGTVKYYLREGLLAEGRKRTTNRADYSDEHLRRLRLLRLLREVGDVPVERLHGLVAALDAHDDDHLAVLDRGSRALARKPRATTEHREDVLARAEQLVRDVGWTHLSPDSPPFAELLGVLDVLTTWEDVGPTLGEEQLRRYALAADDIGRLDIASLDAPDAAGMLAQLVVGQVAYGRLLDVLRRLAEEHHAGVRFSDG